MAAWKYIKGSDKDFEGAPDWCVQVVRDNQTGDKGFEESVIGNQKIGDRIWWPSECDENEAYTLCASDVNSLYSVTIIAQRERVNSINDDRLAQDVVAINPKYNRPCKGVTIDVYDVLQAFNVTNPALQHLVKKALAVGQRGHKDKMEDLRDILASAQRAIELEEVGK